MAKATEWKREDYLRCGICTGYFKPFPRRQLKLQGRPVCPWCFTRGGRFLMLFVRLAEEMSKRPCEDPTDVRALKGECKCPSCMARAILAFRTKKVGEQLAPIDAK